MNEILIIPEVVETVVLLIEPEQAVEILIADNGTVVRQLSGVTINDLPLAVEVNGQTEFNVFSLPTGRHYLMINGLEHYAPDHYTVAQVGANVRLTWLGAHLITTSMKLIFRTLN